MYVTLNGSNSNGFVVNTRDLYYFAIYSCIWCLRSFYDRNSSLKDARLFVVLSLLLYFNERIHCGIVGSILNLATIEGALFLIQRALCSLSWATSRSGESEKLDIGPAELSLKPRIFPCRTTHTRMFPKIHSFSYSYLMIGVPVGWRGTICSMVSADLDMMHTFKSTYRTYKGWFNIEAADYLARGNAHLGLRGKLHAYLKSQGESPDDYPLAYLVTAPRFLGYSFNPVSFWYLYDLNQHLKAMVLEVNNTFDERRMYFLKNSNDDTEPPPMADDLSKKPDLPPQPSDSVKPPAKFSNTWRKDFHVSPFNSRKGSYGLSALDPFALDLTKSGSINNSITLSSSKDHAKLVARIFSTEPSIDPSIMSLRQKIRFIMSWWWVGFVTFPRIVKEAGNLFFRRKLHVWYRPEVLQESIGRKETDRERYSELNRKATCKLLITIIQNHRSTVPQFSQILHRTFLPSILPQVYLLLFHIPSRRRKHLLPILLYPLPNPIYHHHLQNPYSPLLHPPHSLRPHPRLPQRRAPPKRRR